MYKYSWDLEKYFYKGLDDPKLNKDIENIQNQVENFVNKYKGQIKKFSQPRQLLNFFQDEEKLSVLVSKVFHYLFYLNSLDSQDQEVIKKLLEVETLYNQLQEELLFIDEEFKQLGEKKLLEFANSKELKPYKYFLIHKAKTLKYLLSEKEEALITKFSLVDSQVENLYNEFHNGLTFEIVLNGKKQTLTEEEVRSLRSDPDPKTRRKAYKALRKVYGDKKVKTVLSNLYSTFVKNWVLNVKIRGYKTVMEPRNISEDLPNEVVDLLMDQVKKHYFLFQKYVRLKVKLLKKRLPLPVQDLMAPVVDLKSKYTKQEAIKIHLEVMKNFDNDFYNYSVNLLKEGRVDFDPKKGKRGGAYASYSKGQESFVLLNFTNKLRDIFTLSHEFGHAIHGWLSQIQPEQVYDSPLSLAETASIFNEMLLSEYLLSKELSKEEKIYLLESKLEDIFATIFRQIQYVDFEKQVHTGIYEGKQFSHEDYCKLRRQTQLEMSANTIKYDVSPEEETGWSMIPHIFHTPFYCYSYAFGNILTFSLYDKYKKEGKKFVSDYKKILASGGSLPPKELLEQFGIDITKEDFYKSAFNQIEHMLNKLEELI